MLLFLSNAGRLLVSLLYFAVINRSVFPLVMILLFMIVAAFAVATQVAVPFIYTIF